MTGSERQGYEMGISAGGHPAPGVVLVLGGAAAGGKSTTAMHLIVAFLELGLKVASLDLDSRRGRLSHFLDNRFRHARDQGIDLSMPHHEAVSSAPPPADDGGAHDEAEIEQLEATIARLRAGFDIVIVDTPGQAGHLARFVHSCADLVLTPAGGIGIGVVADRGGPNDYAELVWEQRKTRARRDRRSVDWIVLSGGGPDGRPSPAPEQDRGFADLAPRFGFRMAPGLTWRSEFETLFAHGLTVMDAQSGNGLHKLTLPVLAARQEVRRLVEAIGVPAVFPDLEPGRSGDNELSQ